MRPMNFKTVICTGLIACALLAEPAFADEAPAATPEADSAAPGYREDIQQIIERAQDLIGIRYRRSGDKPQTGFDCSGFVGYVFREVEGLILPRVSRDISKAGTPVAQGELKAGDLVFFNTMRHAFSHVGIYLGDNLFVHAPRTGQTVRIDDMQGRYWAKRFNGARRVSRTSASKAQY